eukprot:1220744-Amphidinium_carterae.1
MDMSCACWDLLSKTPCWMHGCASHRHLHWHSSTLPLCLSSTAAVPSTPHERDGEEAVLKREREREKHTAVDVIGHSSTAAARPRSHWPQQHSSCQTKV